jgi:hypothetical protein
MKRTWMMMAVGASISMAAAADEGLLVGAAKDAADAAPAPALDDRKAPLEQQSLDPLVGTWRCTGTSNTEFGADAPTALTWKVQRSLQGRWLSVSMEWTPKARGAVATTTQEVWGYSSAKGGFVRVGAGSDGAVFSSSSAGMTDAKAGKSLVFAGDTVVQGRAGRDRVAIEVTADKAASLSLSSGLGDELRVVFEGTCRR